MHSTRVPVEGMFVRSRLFRDAIERSNIKTMSLATKNVATVLVGSAMVLALSFAVATPAKADMLSDLQAQVQALLAQIAALSGGSTTTSGSGCFAFTMTHQMGDTGGEVMQIQKFLNSHGAQVAASGAGSMGNESSYFGALTRAAVAKWQAANGVSPAAGYWGPITRAKVASICAGAGTGTGTGTGSTGLNGTAGTASITSTSEDVEEDVLTGQTEKVMGFRVEAQGSDLRVTNIRVKFDKDDSTGSASDMLSAYFSEVSIWANGTKIGSMSASSFTRDSAGVYSASIPVDQIVRMGSGNRMTFHVGATANNSVDSDDIEATNDWIVDVTQVRYTDATGAVLFEDPSSSTGNSGVNVDRLSNSSDVTFRMGEGSGNPTSGNVEVDTDSGEEVTLMEFTLKAEGADMYFDQLTASTTAEGVSDTATMVQTFFLMRGDTEIAEEDATAVDGQVLTFSLDDTENISSGSTQTYRIVAKLNGIAETSGSATEFDQGDSITASTSPSVGAINVRTTSVGKVIDADGRSGSVTGEEQFFYSEGIQVSMVSDTFSLLSNDTAANVAGEFVVTLKITNFGSDDVYIPLTALASTTADADATASLIEGINFYMTDGSTATTSSAADGTLLTGNVDLVSGGDEQDNSVRIGGGASAEIKLTTAFNPAPAYTGTRQYKVQVLSVGHSTADDATPETVSATVPLSDFDSSSRTIQN